MGARLWELKEEEGCPGLLAMDTDQHWVSPTVSYSGLLCALVCVASQTCGLHRQAGSAHRRALA